MVPLSTHRKDAFVQAPPAQWYARNPLHEELQAALEPPSPQEIIQAQDVEIRRLQNELQMTKVTAGTIANATVALTHMVLEAQDKKGTEVRIPREMRNRLDGAQVKVRAEADGDIFVSYTGGNEPVWDGRPDG